MSIVALVDLSVVIVAEVNVALVSERLATVRLVTARFVILPDKPRMVAEAVVPIVVPVTVVKLADVPVRVPIVAEVVPNCVMFPLE